VVRARLQGDVGGGAAGIGTCCAQGHDFGVAFAGALGVAMAGHPPVTIDYRATDPGVRVGQPN
jgi:hypothetical protein